MSSPSPLPPTYVIAEAGVNHNGSFDEALRMVDAAKKAGAHAIKFQTFRTEKLVTRHAQKADYQKRNTGSANTDQFQMLKSLELSYDDFRKIACHCAQRNIEFLSTPFDLESLEFLVRDLGMETVKVPSGDITNGPVLFRAAALGCKIILSTGMSTIDDIENALKVIARGFIDPQVPPSSADLTCAYSQIRPALQDKVTLLHCTTEYPAPLEEVNLSAIEMMAQHFGLPVGYSDHTMGISVSIAAAALGAAVIEKHFTLDRNAPGPDHKASLMPDELSQMVAAIADVRLAFGSRIKAPSPSEIKNRVAARRSLVAACPIRAGERFSPSNVTLKRPGGGHTGLEYWDWIGKEASRDYAADEMLD